MAGSGKKWSESPLGFALDTVLTGALFHCILQASGKDPVVTSPDPSQLGVGLVQLSRSVKLTWALRLVLQGLGVHLPQQE